MSTFYYNLVSKEKGLQYTNSTIILDRNVLKQEAIADHFKLGNKERDIAQQQSISLARTGSWVQPPAPLLKQTN